MAKEKKKEKKKPIGMGPLEPISQPGDDQQQAPPKDLQVVDEPDISLEDLPELEEFDGDINVGSGSGLLDLSLQQDGTSFGEDVLGEIYDLGGQGDLQKAPSKEAIKAKASLKEKVFYHDAIMNRLGYNKVHDYYYTNGRRNILFANDEKGVPQAFVIYALNLKGIVPPGKYMRTIETLTEPRLSSYQFFDELGKNYFVGDGVLGQGITPNNEHSRVAFAYSVAYSPDKKDELEDNIKAIVEGAQKKHVSMWKEIEDNLGKPVTAISGEATFNLYGWGIRNLRRLKEI